MGWRSSEPISIEEGSDAITNTSTNETEDEDSIISDIDEISKDEGEDKVISSENVDTVSSGSTMITRSGMWYMTTVSIVVSIMG